MIVLTVISYNGAPSEGLSANFDELGGTIGRADNNQLVLPDPERTISRVHARVVFRTTGYMVVDNGSNPISVNGSVLGAGREHPLAPGDQLQIGGYLLGVTVGTAARGVDPFAELFGDAPLGAAVPPAAPVARRSVTQTWAPAEAAPAPPVSLAPGRIPDDWDPFADLGRSASAAPSTPTAAPTPPLPPDLLPGLAGPGVASAGDSLDDLFGLSSAPSGGDPLGAPPAQALLNQPNTAGHADPLQALLQPASAAPPASLGDVGSELNTPMPLPRRARPLAAPAVDAPRGAIFSWDEPTRDGRVITLPGVHRAEVPPPAPVAVPAPPAARTPSAVAAAPAADDEPLLAALLAGLDVPGLRLEALTPDGMHLIGTLLRESTRGAVELLLARAALKREMRAELTMIVARENNPLKFSPSVEVALQHLLAPPAPGFMPAAAAVRDAFDDLRAHQIGVMAGMRAALDGVLQRFDPQQLEAKITRKSAIAGLIPATRKARLWELFQELFSQLSSEAQDDFDELFGKAFLKAYEAQLDRLRGEPGPR